VTTIATVTAANSHITSVVTFKLSTLSNFASLTTPTTVVTVNNSATTSVTIGPGGIVWDCNGCNGNPDFSSVSFPTLPPPVISTIEKFPSAVFPPPQMITSLVTSTKSGGDVLVNTQTFTRNSQGQTVPAVTLQTPEAVSAAMSIASSVQDISKAILAYSQNLQNQASSSAALAAVRNGQAGKQLPSSVDLSSNYESQTLAILESDLQFLQPASAEHFVPSYQDSHLY
jgi:hypothetical protein